MGKGLDIQPEGTHIAFSAGTGCLVFVDLVAHLLRKNLGLLGADEEAQLGELVLQLHNPLLLVQELLQVALKCNQLGVMYLNDNIPAQLLAPQPQQQQPLAFF